MLLMHQPMLQLCQGPDPTIVETIRPLSESRVQWTRIRTCRRLRTKDERSHGEANRIHGTKKLIVLGIPPPRPSVPTKPGDHGVLLFFENNKATLDANRLLFSKGPKEQ